MKRGANGGTSDARQRDLDFNLEEMKDQRRMRKMGSLEGRECARLLGSKRK